jgi:predicted peptidase
MKGHLMSGTLLTLLSSSIAGLAAVPAASAADSWQDLYQANTYKTSDGQTLPYRLLKPEKLDSGKRYPLVLFLHGAGERGTDNAKQLVHGAGAFATPENRQKYPCFVVAPQCPANAGWAYVEGLLPSRDGPGKTLGPLRLALELIDKLTAEMPVDKGRLYITGLSMGGFGTWEAIQRRPDFFAAAIPICGGGDAAQASKLKGVPIWAFHGESDPVVPASGTTTMIETIRKAGGAPKMTMYPGVGHDSWTRTYADRAVLAWLFAQKK